MDNLFSDPNGPAYQKAEARTGPPLDYVASKLRCCLERLHDLHHDLQRCAVTGPTVPAHAQASRFSWDAEVKTGPAAAFHYALVAHLALNNMLAVANAPDLEGRLLGLSPEEFSAWLDGVDREGSVTG